MLFGSLIVVGIISVNGVYGQKEKNNDFSFNITQVTDSIYMLSGGGGNVGVSVVDDDGIFLIDDKYTNLTDEMLNAIIEISDKPIKFIINTH